MFGRENTRMFAATLTIVASDTVRDETNSNDFGGFWN